MKKIRAFFSKWYVQLALVLIPLAMGLTGYIAYYREYYRLVVPTGSCSYGQPLFSALGLFGMSYDASWIEGTDRWAWYYVVLNIARYLAVIPTSHAVFKLLSPLLGRFTGNMRCSLWQRRVDRLMIVGANEENLGIFKSFGDGRRCIIACAPGEACAAMEQERAPRVQADLEKLIQAQVRRALDRGGAKCTLLINTHDETKNLRLCRAAVDCVLERVSDDRRARDALAARGDLGPEDRRRLLDLERRLVDLLDRLRVIVFGDSQYETIYLGMRQESLGVVKFTNRYRVAAVGLVSRHPLTEHLVGPNAALLDGRGCVAPKADFNVLLVGFGDTNQEVFRTYFATNQFIQAGDDALPRLKQVNYHIFDRQGAHRYKNLNHTVFRYCVDFERAVSAGQIDPRDYLPLPEAPARTEFYATDTDDLAFYRQVLDICSVNPNAVNTVVIAVGDDLTNIDLAQRLCAKKQEWGLENLYIFTRIRDPKNEGLMRPAERSDYVAFGSESLRLKDILETEVESMAYRRNLMYALAERQTARGDETAAEVETRTRYAWYAMDDERRESNIYDVLSLRMKLQLIGLDYAPRSDGARGLRTNGDYFALYARDDAPKPRPTQGHYKGKDIYSYEGIQPLSDYARGSLRDNLAIQEHYRWNAFMIARGFIPATLDQMQAGRVKDYRTRYHGNLTTFEGLFEFRRRMAAWKGTDQAAEDVVRWDYQVMDDAWWFLNENGFDIVKR